MFAISHVNKDGILSLIVLGEYEDALVVYSTELTYPSAAATGRTPPVAWLKEPH